MPDPDVTMGPKKREPKEHVLRPALPWRLEEDGLTECGIDAQDCRAISREMMERKVAEQGQTRASFTSCMTCWSAIRDNVYAEQRLGTDIAVLRRAFDRHNEEDMRRIRHEIGAIRLLVAAHRAEFDAIVDACFDAARSTPTEEANG